MNNQIIGILEKRFFRIRLSEDERLILEAWMKDSQHHHDTSKQISSKKFRQDLGEMMEYKSKRLWNKISKQLNLEKQDSLSS